MRSCVDERGRQAAFEMDPHETYFQSLSAEAKQLVILQRILYEGSWEEMIQDLEARQQGRPFIYKLQTRIEEDLDRIRLLAEYEKHNDVRLSNYVERPRREESGEREAHGGG